MGRRDTSEQDPGAELSELAVSRERCKTYIRVTTSPPLFAEYLVFRVPVLE